MTCAIVTLVLEVIGLSLNFMYPIPLIEFVFLILLTFLGIVTSVSFRLFLFFSM